MSPPPLTRRALLASGLAGLGTALLADAPLSAMRPRARPGSAAPADPAPSLPEAPPEAPPLRDSLAQIVADANLGPDVAVLLADAQSGEVLEAHRPDAALPPASVTKVLTALYALDHLGPEYRFRTRVLATGPIREGVVQGDLILAGGGDPTLDTDALGAMVAQLRAQGIAGITGAFRAWGGLLPKIQEIEPSQLDHLGYNPAVSGLNLNFNRVHFEWKRVGADYKITMQARTKRYRPDIALARMKVADRKSPIYTFADLGPVDSWSVARHALGAGGVRLLPVREPGLYAAEAFRAVAGAEGLALPEPVLSAPETAPKGDELAHHLSQELLFVLEDMLLYSTNLTAEVVGLMASRSTGTRPGTIAESAAQMQTWLRDRYSIGAQFSDHSGLSDQNRIDPEALVKVLRAARGAEILPRILKTMPFNDRNRAPISDYPGHVAAKTGTLNFVSALSGYVTTASGRALAFAILSADPGAREASKSSLEDKPPGAASWNTRAKRLQEVLYRRWALID